MMMMKASLFAVLALSAYTVDAATKIAVLELGKGGTVRRTTSKNTLTNVQGVASFWSAVHSRGRSLQQSGMTVVPDLFNKADAGVVFGIQGSGVDLDNMPFISFLLDEESENVVGHMEMDGSRCGALMKTISNVEDVEPEMIANTATKHAAASGLSGFKTLVDSANASAVEEQLKAMIENMEREAKAAGTTVVLHFIVEEDEASASASRRVSRRLEDEQDENEGNDQNQNQNNNAYGGDSSGYYGYGYYNNYGEWVTPYKTMFQIQYFNVVLWTSLGLALTLYFTIYMMVYMPLEPDTLLFGESAKMVGDE
jgi:hypothetical protein